MRRFGQLWLSVGCKSAIELRKLIPEHIHRPAVDDDIVYDEKQHVIVDAKPEEPRPEQGSMLRVDGLQAFSFGFQLRHFDQEGFGP